MSDQAEPSCTCGGGEGSSATTIAVTPTATISTNVSNSTPRYCTHRTKYRSTKSEGDQHSLSSGSIDERDLMDMKLVKIRPQFSEQKEPEAAVAPKTSSSIVVKKHLVNESLDKYVVLRQKSFHGYLRSKDELRTLPLTDPRDNDVNGPQSWLHRSKTDLYVEKRFGRKQKQDRTNNIYNLDMGGLNLLNLVENLPSTKKEYAAQKRERTADKIRKGLTTSQSQPLERLPPLTADNNPNEGKKAKKTEGKVQRPWSDGMQNVGLESHKTATPRSQRKSVTVPLRVWDSGPSLDFLLVSHPKVIHTREPFPMNAMMANGVARQQASPLK